MSSSAHLIFNEGEEVLLDDWLRFAAEHELTYVPQVVGYETFRHDRLPVEVWFGRQGFCPPPGADGRIDFSQCSPPAEARRIVFSTYFEGSAMPDVAELAVAAWQEFGGALDACPEIRRLIGVMPA